ncbi:MAG TPA: DegT/DnrJ/EryC1/StrS family aminotransferase, partial [Acidimicrobiales bacterium]|nr:DegT/DnrJ/EryC1/StrS family aminotransferase [Acidimicrobiales bacterium]
EFEAKFAERVGRRFAVALPSCTSALHLVLAAFGVGPGDEVIVPEATWIASAAPISYVGASPVFADIDPMTWCVDPASVERCVSARTRAVIAVDLYGGMPDHRALEELCATHGIALIEDAAEAIGSSLDDRPAGAFGTGATFSFHGSKTLTTGEGGMLVLDDEQLCERVQVLRDHGRRPGDVSFRNEEVAFKYKMSSLQAALGAAQLDRLDELVTRKRQVFGWYRERLAAVQGVQLNCEPPGVRNSYWMTTAVVDPDFGLDKETIGKELGEHGIDTRPFFHPLSSLPAYRDLPEAARAQSTNATSRRVCAHGINLPSALRLEEDEVDYVCHHLRSLLTR